MHGGSLRIILRHLGAESVSPRVGELLSREKSLGLQRPAFYRAFGDKVAALKQDLLQLLHSLKQSGKRIAAYGTPAKGNTLLNYCGIRTDFLDYVVDRNPYKQGKFLPGTHIPIYHPSKLQETKPDHVLILPWNLKAEVMSQISYIREWGGQFIVPIPEVEVFS